MKIWIDAQLSPAIARWISENCADAEAVAVRDIGYRDAEDSAIYFAARTAQALVMTKDRDFVELQNTHKAPPKIIWITCGNTSNSRLCEILKDKLPAALEILARGEDLVEITGL